MDILKRININECERTITFYEASFGPSIIQGESESKHRYFSTENIMQILRAMDLAREALEVEIDHLKLIAQKSDNEWDRLGDMKEAFDSLVSVLRDVLNFSPEH